MKNKKSRPRFCHSPVTRLISPFAHWDSEENNEKIYWKKGKFIPIGRNGKPQKIIVDFGKEVGGYLKVHWGRVKGHSIRFYFSESLEELQPAGDVLLEVPFSKMLLSSKHVYSGRGETWWRAPVLRGGFRYMLIAPDKNVKAEIKDIEIEADFYIPENGNYPGAFECSDKLLNRIWYGAAYTMQVATKRPWESFVFGCDHEGAGEWVIFDGAKRDRAVWSLDLAISTPSYFLSLWNPEAVRHSLLTLLSQKGKGGFALKSGYIPHSAFPTNRMTWLPGTFITFSVYVLWWIRGVYFYYLYTGDREFVKSVFHDIREGLRWFETQTKSSPESKTPLFFANGLNDLSWDYTLLRSGFSGATNMVWAKTLEEAAWLAERVAGDNGSARRYKERAKGIRKAVFEKGFKPYDLWDNRLGRFRHTTKEDKPFTLEVNAQAVLFDFVEGKPAHRLLDLMAERLHVGWGSLSSDTRFPWALSDRHNSKVMPSLVAYEAAALMKYGRYKEALELTKRTWGPMLERGTETTFWEWYGNEGRHTSAYASLCHPWSAWLLQVLTEALTGIKPVRAGYSSFELNPSAVALCREIDHCAFQIPTPRGKIVGEWHRDRMNVIYKAELPEGTEGKISPPLKSVVCEDMKRKEVTGKSKFSRKIELKFKG